MRADALAAKPTLRGKRVLLRPFTEEDIAAMGPILADPEVQILTGSVGSTEEAAAASPELDERTLQWYRSRAEQADRLDLAVIDAETGRCVGEVVLNELSVEDRSCNFRILIGPEGRGRGLGTEATRLTVEHGLAAGLHRISLTVFTFNPRARRAYEKAGFVYEGTRRDVMEFDGAWLSEDLMSVLSTDPGWGSA
ncbi:GNAT family N-acetyltransferase [Galactobacter valiniphilus]|uniref:GNAT family N-acetyltransferase n=1 Tax=Galactobacter valiniphilus TaxID=2676122 RepID=UPI003735C2CC